MDSKCCSIFAVCLALAWPFHSSAADTKTAPAELKAAVFSDSQLGASPELAREFADAIADAGYVPEFIDHAALSNTNVLKRERYAMLVLPGAQSLPLGGLGSSISNYLQQGGHLMAAGLPAWGKPLHFINGKWISQEAYEQAVAAQSCTQVLFDFSTQKLSKWGRTSNDPKLQSHAELIPHNRGKALHVTMEALTGWETLSSPNLTNPVPPDHVLTCFRAKGDGKTPRLVFEWDESDGTRWLATVDLTNEWRSYVLTPEAFQRWPTAAPANHHLQMHKTVRCVVGLAQSHTPMEPGDHEYWIEAIGTAPHPFGNERLSDNKPPILETFSPPYLFYPATGPVRLQTPAALGLVTPAHPKIARSATVTAMHPRARNMGFDQRRSWRWQPVLEACARDGDYRGAIASMSVHFNDDFQGGVWTCFTPAELTFFQQPEMKRMLRECARQMRRGIFLREGGSEFFTVFEDQTFRLGARAANLGRENQSNLLVRLSVKSGNGIEVFVREWPLDLNAGQEKVLEETWKPQNWPETGFTVTTELISKDTGELVIDRLSHELQVWRPKATPDFIKLADGQFWLKGKPWKINGVNYMPSSGIGLGDRHFEFWLGRGAYDPEVIERDLRRIKEMGLNAVSVFIYHESLHAQHLLDLLRRCEQLGLHANQSLRPGTPMNFLWDQMRELIEYYRLAQNDTVFAYDLAWEPSHRVTQHSHGKAWTAWVKARYGSLSQAQKRWNLADVATLDETGEISVPTMAQFTQDGVWRKFVVDFRTFLDQELAKNYAEARRLVKSVDPNHAVSFRMSLAGDPTANVDDVVPYDFFGLTEAVDIWEPEAYGRIGDWERVKPGRFTSDYARLCDPKKPLIWAEMGYTVWDRQRMRQDPRTLGFMAQYTTDFYRMLRESGANGIFFWWYPGGFRVGENSDFGIINPDGTDRPMTRVIRKEGLRFLAHSTRPSPNHWITVDRDQDARGLYGLYRRAEQEYWKVIEEGRTPGLRWAAKPGTSRE